MLLSLVTTPAPRTRRAAFTLIELLVVISIIALLVALLLPALSAAKKSGRNIKCVTQTRSIGVALAIYMNDHNQYFPYGFIETPSIAHYFDTTLNEYIGVRTAVGDYHDTENSPLWHCTEMWDDIPAKGWGVYAQNPNMMGYLFNNAYVNTSYGPYASGNRNFRETDLATRPSNTVTFYEGMYPTSTVPVVWFEANKPSTLRFANPHFVTGGIPYDSTTISPTTNGGAFNPVFLDGHAASLKPSDFPAYGTPNPPESYCKLR